jgi:hypothetical protein
MKKLLQLLLQARLTVQNEHGVRTVEEVQPYCYRNELQFCQLSSPPE